MYKFNYKNAPSSPWGRIDNVTSYDRGFSFVSTPGHGGFRVGKAWLKKHCNNPKLITKLGAIETKNYYWFEEDCAAQLVLVDSLRARQTLSTKQEHLTPEKLYNDARASVLCWYPSYFGNVEFHMVTL